MSQFSTALAAKLSTVRSICPENRYSILWKTPKTNIQLLGGRLEGIPHARVTECALNLSTNQNSVFEIRN